MLRITRIESPTEQKLLLEGRLAESWSADLSSHWEEARRAHDECKFVVDLKGVTRIDAGGERALATMKSQGAEFLASGVRRKQLLKDLGRQGARKTHTAGPDHSIRLAQFTVLVGRPWVGLASDYHVRGASDLLPLTGERSAPRQFLSVIAPLTAKRLLADRRDQHALTERNSLVVQSEFEKR
jgi:anti-anti-sigma regulatory factor